MAQGKDRSRQALDSLISGLNKEDSKKDTTIKPEPKLEPEVLNKKSIEKIIIQQGNSKRSQDSYRVNPILFNALKYWTSIGEPNKSKPDIIEEAILRIIPEEYLVQGYEMAKKQNKI
ncbi:hypothetical protein [Enterococcus wangshanyuanii]|uniref:Uncharacterized protein n=1 Tax=Enterococcus wangshanyuanii TaxID=2005703 RepID=A0ABQ1PST0_9ENTE|nr:hypothetical protein [Enterococcus wangshanyuanii]GGD03124.1 hypothetical protein GCM10011573_35770 [Enterococcus wangshanyuanii]